MPIRVSEENNNEWATNASMLLCGSNKLQLMLQSSRFSSHFLSKYLVITLHHILIESVWEFILNTKRYRSYSFWLLHTQIEANANISMGPGAICSRIQANNADV